MNNITTVSLLEIHVAELGFFLVALVYGLLADVRVLKHIICRPMPEKKGSKMSMYSTELFQNVLRNRIY